MIDASFASANPKEKDTKHPSFGPPELHPESPWPKSAAVPLRDLAVERLEVVFSQGEFHSVLVLWVSGCLEGFLVDFLWDHLF